MKYIALFIFAFAATAFGQAPVDYVATPTYLTIQTPFTNTITADVRKTSAVGLSVSFNGGAADTTTSVLGVTNAANTAGGQTLSLTLAGTTSVYTWTNNVLANVTNVSSPQTNITVGVTNGANATNGQTLTVVLNNVTNVFTWTNTPIARTDILTNANANAAATNLSVSLARYFNTRSVAVSGSLVTLLGQSTDYQLSAALSAGWGTNDSGIIYGVTNVVATNSLQIQTTNTEALCATNLFNRLNSDYSNALAITYASATSLQLVTRLNPGFGVALSGTWGTNQLTTNAIAGELFFKGSNSVDNVKWSRFTGADFSVAYSGTSAVVQNTNFSVGPYGYYAWSVENARTNYAWPSNLLITTSSKNGL